MGFLDRMYENRQLEKMGPSQQELGQTMLEEAGEGEVDWEGTPGWSTLQDMYDRKRRAQAPFGPMEKKEGKEEKTVKVGKSGFEPISANEQAQARKTQVFNKIQEKREQGLPISTAEARYEKKYLGIKDTKKLPETPQDLVRVRKIAKDMAQSAFIEQGVEGAVATEEDIQAQMPEATKFLYPNADPVEVEQKDYSITLPKGMTNVERVHNYLVNEVGMEPTEAAMWMKSRKKAGE